MKTNYRIFSWMGIAAVALPIFAAQPNLPKVEILGKEYFYHEIKKGESIYGIAKQHGWDLNELIKLNPNASSEMKKGSRLYYPVDAPVSGNNTNSGNSDRNVNNVVSDNNDNIVRNDSNDSADSAEQTSYEPIRHVVRKGETVYSISRQYNVPLEQIYEAYPNARYGIKAGETIVIQQSPETVSDKYLYYVVKHGDTLYSLAKRYHTTVEDILSANPAVSGKNFKAGETVRIAVNSNSKNVHTETVEEERLASVESYKVGKNETWETISQKTGVDESTLRDANENTTNLKKNTIVNVPVVETVQVEKVVETQDPRELSSEGIQEMYDSIHNIDSDRELLNEVKVAAILDEPTSKKDVDFTRGFLLAIDELKNSPYKINFKVIDGRGATTSVTDALDDFEPNLIVATADKNFPAFLADYGNTNHIEVVNVFDVKNELFEDNPSMVQILPPSTFFNQHLADRIYDEYSSRKVIVVGNEDANDGIAEILLPKYSSDKVTKRSIAALSDTELGETDSYLIYAYSNKKEEISDILHSVDNLREKYPATSITLVGRPSWVMLTDTYGDRFSDAEVLIPSRVWFDADSSHGSRFNASFSDMYGGHPVKSFPNFAASGYDVAKYFIPSTAANGGDFNRGFSGSDDPTIQTDINLVRVNNWGGFINPTGYLLKFRKGGFIDKELVK